MKAPTVRFDRSDSVRGRIRWLGAIRRGESARTVVYKTETDISPAREQKQFILWGVEHLTRMKKCSYCGRDNADDAANCHECGTEFEAEAAAVEAESTNAEAETKTLTVRIFSTHEAAEIAAAKLKAHSIECWVSADDCAGMYPSLTTAEGARLQVREEDQAIAQAVLEAKPTPEEEKGIEIAAVLSHPKKTEPESEREKKFAWGPFVVGLMVGMLVSLFYQWREGTAPITHYHYTADGKRDGEWIYRNRQLAEYVADRNLDGQWDEWIHYENGRRVRAEYDNNFDGKPDVFWTFSEHGTDTVQEDTDFNGIPDLFCTYKNQIIRTAELRPNGSKFATLREYFKDGNLVELWRGGDSNGNFREVIRFDPFLNPISTNTPDELLSLKPEPGGSK